METEVASYLKLKVQPINADLLRWWHSNATVAFAKAIGFKISLHTCGVSIFGDIIFQYGVNCCQVAISFSVRTC